MDAGKFSENQPCEEETDEPNDQSDEEEEKEHCPPLEETMAASWIAQVGEEGLSETEAVDSFIAMNEHRTRTWEAQELKKAARRIADFLIAYNSAKSSEWYPAAATVNASIFDFHGR